jgi:broad specificity phosphatase PhoE
MEISDQQEVTLGQIYLVRHGETAWNKAKIFRGRRDIPLDDQGRLEAACAARALREVPLVALYSSPLSRARETAEAIAAGHGLPVIVDEAFTDIDYGEWTEYWDAEARRKFGDQYRQWKESPHRVKFPGGESLDDVRRRAAPRLMELARQHSEGTIALVSHRVVLKLLLCEAKGLDNSHFWEVRLDTGAISVLEYGKGTLRVAVENDTRHFQGLTDRGSVDF